MKRKEKIAAGFLIFLAVMWMCTLISKSIYASQLPRVTTVLAEKKRIEHVVETDGIVKQGSDMAVHTMPGLRVRKICVRVGDEVEEGSELFWLDKEDLEELIEAKKLEAAKMEYQIEDLKENRALDEMERQKGIRRAEEDRETAGNKAGTALERAEEELRQAEGKLDSFNRSEPPVTSEEEKQKAYAAYNDWLEQGKQMEATVSGNQISVSEKEKYLEEMKGQGNEAVSGFPTPSGQSPKRCPPDPAYSRLPDSCPHRADCPHCRSTHLLFHIRRSAHSSAKPPFRFPRLSLRFPLR